MADSLLPILDTADTNANEYITANGVTLACREGCDYCCYLRVTAYPHEASSIADYIRDNFTDNEIDELRGRLKRHVELVDDMTEEQHQTSNIKHAVSASH